MVPSGNEEATEVTDNTDTELRDLVYQTCMQDCMHCTLIRRD